METIASIAFFELEPWEEEYIKKWLKGHKIKFFRGSISESMAKKAKDADILAVFIYSKVNSKVLNAMKNVKWVTTMSTGFDHIDLKECKKRKISVSNVPTYGANTVAEHTFGMILTLSRKLHQSIERTKKGGFECRGLMGFDLRKKTIGVIGAGNIGMHVIRMAKGFDMNVIAFDIKKDMKAAKKLGFKYASLDTLIKKSDIISIHSPYNKKTHHLINKDAVKKMKKGVIIINTARGSIIDTGSLIYGLKNRIIAGAGLDVLEEECAIKEEKQLLSSQFLKKCNLKVILENHALQRMENVIITPHNAFNSKEALLRIVDTTISNIKSFLKKKPINTVK